MRRLIGIVLWTGGLLAAAAIALAVVFTLAGDTFYRWAAGQVLASTVDRPVHLDGAISLSLGGEVALTVTDVWIENAPWAKRAAMARLARAEARIALSPLLKGIVRIPRLAIDGMTVDLERTEDGVGNWMIAEPVEEGDPSLGTAEQTPDDEAGSPARSDAFVPILESVSLRNVAVTYQGGPHEAGIAVVIDAFALDKSADDQLQARGSGRINQHSLELEGYFGSVKAALAAAAPYPMNLTVTVADVVAAIIGTARDLPRAEGFDFRLTADVASIQKALAILDIDLPVDGAARAEARLQGDLPALAVDDLSIEVTEPAGDRLLVEGRVDDLLAGEGLDVRVSAVLGPHPFGWVPVSADDEFTVLRGVEQVELGGRISGAIDRPAFEDLRADLVHASGATLSARGRMELALADDSAILTALDATAALAAPDGSLLREVAGDRLGALGPLSATSKLALADGRMRIEMSEIEAPAFAEARLTATGEIGRLTEDGGGIVFAPRLDIDASLAALSPVYALLGGAVDFAPQPTAGNDGRGLPAPSGAMLIRTIQQGLHDAGIDPGPRDGLIGPRTRRAIRTYQARHGLDVDGRVTSDLLRQIEGHGGHAGPIPDPGPVTASARLSTDGDMYRLDDLRLRVGERDVWIEVEGTVGSIRPADDFVPEEIALAVRLASPSGPQLAGSYWPDWLDLHDIRARFDLLGSADALSLTNADVTANGLDGLRWRAVGGIGTIALHPAFAMDAMDFALAARSPTTAAFIRLFGIELPELGPVRGRATVRSQGGRFTLGGIDVAAGPSASPVVRVDGGIGDLAALEQIRLDGSFDVATATLLELDDLPSGQSALGIARGRFRLSDTNGSFGIDALTATVRNTSLFDLSARGVFDDIEAKDGLHFETALSVPNMSDLATAIGFDVGRVGGFTFDGMLSGSDARYQAKGTFRLGETLFSGTLVGSNSGARPAIEARLFSPVVYLADLGLGSSAETSEDSDEQDTDDALATDAWLFDEDPIAFDVLEKIDLDLEIEVDQVEGLNFAIDRVEAKVDVTDGSLSVDPVSLGFAEGRLETRLFANGRVVPPQVRLDLLADDLDLGDFLAQVETDVPLDGMVDLLAHLEAAGESPRALARTLAGDIDLALAGGHLRTSLLDLTVTNPLRWLFSRSRRRGYSALNCLIARFDVWDGIANSVTLLLDTSTIRVDGAGAINFADESLALDFRPRAKERRLIAMATPFGVAGPLSNPRLELNTRRAIMRTLGKTAVSPVNLLGSLLPFVNDRGRDPDNACLKLNAEPRIPPRD